MKTNKLIHYFRLSVRYISQTSGKAIAVFVSLMAALIMVDVLARVFGKTILIADEIVTYLILVVAFFGLARTQQMGKHIELKAVTARLSPKTRGWLKVATLIASVIFLGWFVWATGDAVKEFYTSRAASISFLHTPLWIPYIFVPLGFAMLILEIISELIEMATKGFDKSLTPDSDLEKGVF